jgi:hypothetical protein
MEVIILKNKLLKYLLILLNAFFSSYICVLINLISYITYYGFSFKIFYLDISLIKVAFIISIVPQIILYFISKILKINKFIDLGLILLFGFFPVYLIFFFALGLKEYIIHGYEYYLATIISGVIFRIVLYKINKINIKK